MRSFVTRESDVEYWRRCSFCYDKVVVPNEVLETSGRALNAAYQEKIIDKILFRWMRKWFLPYPMTALYTAAMSVKYIYQGLKILCKGKIEVPVLDATAIGVSILRNDFDTASSIMAFLCDLENCWRSGHIKSCGG